MTVAELIEKLKDYPEDYIVILVASSNKLLFY